ncbi:transport between ER and Golgi ATPase protein [Tulasnella sp. 419]|nr:transport between ER and Golgi ATPase protein [Tulasnella sp. 419]
MSFFRGNQGTPQPPNPNAGYSRLTPDPYSRPTSQQRGLPQPSYARAELIPDSSNYEKRSYGGSSGGGYGQRGGGGGGSRFSVVECPSPGLALSNCLIAHPQDFAEGQVVMLKDTFPLTIKSDNTGKLARGTVGPSAFQRQWIGLSITGDEVKVEAIQTGSSDYLTSLDIEIGFWKRGQEVAEVYDSEEMGRTFLKAFNGLMDGVDQLNNILIIGMTNRLDMIDEALLRPGRLEVHMEISLPDEHGRLQILTIHTAKMRENGVMDRDVNLPELAGLTKNFSGAEINGLVKSATSFAFNRHVKVGTMAGISDDVENLRVNRGDFILALDEVHPAFGVSEEELQTVVQNGIIHYDHHIDEILRDGQLFVEQVRSSTRTPLVTLLLHGPAGSGKTALAATIAQASQFPFIKLLSPDSMVGYSETQKIATINKVFSDSYKSPLSVIVVDNIERLLDWVPIGPRFSNGVLQALMVLLARRPPKGRRLLIIATTSLRPMLDEMQMSEVFDSQIRVPPISSLRSLEIVLREMQLFGTSDERRRAMALLDQAGFGHEGRLMVGVKKLLTVVEMARQEPEGVAERLVSALLGLGM